MRPSALSRSFSLAGPTSLTGTLGLAGRAGLAALLLFCCLAATPAVAQERTFVLEGRYAGSEVGDFAYLLLQEQGRTHSFVCNPLILQALDALQPPLPIVVEFTTTVQFVEGAGEEIEFQVVRSVFVPDEYAPDFGIRLEEAQRP